MGMITFCHKLLIKDNMQFTHKNYKHWNISSKSHLVKNSFIYSNLTIRWGTLNAWSGVLQTALQSYQNMQ